MLNSFLSSVFSPFHPLLNCSRRVIVLLFLFLPIVSVYGCSVTHSTFTVYDLNEKTVASLRQDVGLCRAAGARALPDRTMFWLSMAALYGIEHNTSVATNNCLLSRGWRPKLQFAGPFGAVPGDLETALKKCGAEGGYSGLLAKAEFSGMVAENVIAKAAGAGNVEPGLNGLRQCLDSFGWEVIDRPPWISPDDASSSYVADPVAENIAEKFVVRQKVVRDTGKAIYWLQDNPQDATNCDWHKARRYVIGLNKGRFSGYSDWRIPRRDEVESLLDFARWNAASDMAALLKKLGFNGIEGAVYWTSSPIVDDVSGDGIWGVNFATREYIRLGRSTSFSAHVLPVRGRGWGSSEPELPLYEPTDKEGEGELIAARYHRCKTGNCALVAQKP